VPAKFPEGRRIEMQTISGCSQTFRRHAGVIRQGRYEVTQDCENLPAERIPDFSIDEVIHFAAPGHIQLPNQIKRSATSA